MKLTDKKIPWTAVGVLIFIIVFFWGRDAESGELGIGLGFGMPTTRSESIVAQEIQFRTDDYRWYFSYTRIGANKNKYLRLRQNDRFAAGYTVVWRRDKDWQPYVSLGIAYFEEPPLPMIDERLTYDMRAGVRYKDIVEIEIDNHSSTASRADRNTGLDIAILRAVFQF